MKVCFSLFSLYIFLHFLLWICDWCWYIYSLLCFFRLPFDLHSLLNGEKSCWIPKNSAAVVFGAGFLLCMIIVEEKKVKGIFGFCCVRSDYLFVCFEEFKRAWAGKFGVKLLFWVICFGFLAFLLLGSSGDERSVLKKVKWKWLLQKCRSRVTVSPVMAQDHYQKRLKVFPVPENVISVGVTSTFPFSFPFLFVGGPLSGLLFSYTLLWFSWFLILSCFTLSSWCWDRAVHGAMAGLRRSFGYRTSSKRAGLLFSPRSHRAGLHFRHSFGPRDGS